MQIEVTPFVAEPKILVNISDLTIDPSKSLGFFFAPDWKTPREEWQPLHSFRYGGKHLTNGKLAQVVDCAGKITPGDTVYIFVVVQNANQTQDVGAPSNPQPVVLDAAPS